MRNTLLRNATRRLGSQRITLAAHASAVAPVRVSGSVAPSLFHRAQSSTSSTRSEQGPGASAAPGAEAREKVTGTGV